MAVSSSSGPRRGAGPTPPAADIPVREVVGTAQLGRRTKLLVKRLRPTDIAIIDHQGIDRVSAEELIATGVRAVVNCRPSPSERYPNMGPLLLAQAGVHLVDVPGAPLFDRLRDGDQILVRGGEVIRGSAVLARGEVQDLDRVQALTARRREEIGQALESFARNTVEHMLDERELLAGRLDLPNFDTDFRDRPALVVVRGAHHKEDLRALRPYIRDERPRIVAVDGGANALLDDGFVPDMIVGDMDSATPGALACGAELVVHAYPDGHAPGRDRLDVLGVPYKVVPAPGTSQDVAMLLVAEKGARLIVTVGSQANLVEFLDKNRQGMSSTFLTRLRIGEILVDAKGVSRLYRPRPGTLPLALVLAVGVLVLGVAVIATPGLSEVVNLLWLKLRLLLGIS